MFYINLSSFSLRSFQFSKYLNELNCFTHYRDTFESLVVHKRTTFNRDAGKEKKLDENASKEHFMLCYVCRLLLPNGQRKTKS